jgi:hypothetical protein
VVGGSVVVVVGGSVVVVVGGSVAGGAVAGGDGEPTGDGDAAGDGAAPTGGARRRDRERNSRRTSLREFDDRDGGVTDCADGDDGGGGACGAGVVVGGGAVEPERPALEVLDGDSCSLATATMRSPLSPLSDSRSASAAAAMTVAVSAMSPASATARRRPCPGSPRPRWCGVGVGGSGGTGAEVDGTVVAVWSRGSRKTTGCGAPAGECWRRRTRPLAVEDAGVRVAVGRSPDPGAGEVCG